MGGVCPCFAGVDKAAATAGSKAEAPKVAAVPVVKAEEPTAATPLIEPNAKVAELLSSTTKAAPEPAPVKKAPEPQAPAPSPAAVPESAPAAAGEVATDLAGAG